MSPVAIPDGATPRQMNDSRHNGNRYVAARVLCARPCNAPVVPTTRFIDQLVTHVCDRGHRWHRDRHGKWTAKS